MKKFYKKLLFSIATLLFAMISLVTSTFAWFSMNNTVKVEGLEIQVESNSIFLIVGTENNLATVQTENKTSVDFNMSGAATRVFPAAHDEITNTTDANNVGKWYYQNADAPTSSVSTKEKHYLTSTNYNSYVIHTVLYVTVSVGSNEATNLVVSLAEFSSNSGASGDNPTYAPIKVVVTSSTAMVELDSAHTSSDVVLINSITDQTLIALDIYIYYNGADENVYTNNIVNLDGARINLEFSVDD